MPMKIVTILGSPRNKGNTSKALGFFEQLVGKYCEVDRINIASHKVNGCLACNTCKNDYDNPGCIQKDDAVSIFERMMQSDMVIYASPLYCWSFSSQIKALIDRHYCLVKGYGTINYKSLLEAKLVALLVTCDGPIENNADLIQGVFDRLSGYLRCVTLGKYVVPFCMRPDTIDKKGMDVAQRMVADIVDRRKI
jgi:NAD(P)H-dependent FMN reductase